MSTAAEELLRAYERELTYLRQLGAEFATRYPLIAGRLELSGAESPDPHVERLIEAVAFLTARIQSELDREFPQFTSAFLGVLYPQFLDPVPSMAIARFDVDAERGIPYDGHRIEARNRLYAESVEEDAPDVTFSTSYPVTLWPIVVGDVGFRSTDDFPFLDAYTLELPPGTAAGVVHVRLLAQGPSLSQLSVDKLRFHLGGEGRSAHALYELLQGDLIKVAIVGDREPRRPIFLPPESVRPVGFAPDESLLATRSHAHPAYRLLQEYFAFPEKFLFLDVEPLPIRDADRYVDLLFFVRRRPRVPLVLDERSFQLGCTPIVNLFPRTTEPIRLDYTKNEYRLVANYDSERTLGIHSIVSMSVSSNPTEGARRVSPFFSFEHPRDANGQEVFWHARRLPSTLHGIHGSDLWISFFDLKLTPARPPHDVLFAHALCTNRDLPAQLLPGTVLHLEEAAPLRGISLVGNPTLPVEPPIDESLWRLISQLSLNHLSLTHGDGADSLRALREILRLYRFTAHDTIDQQIDALLEMSTRSVVRRVGVDAWRGFLRGTAIDLVVDETRYVGASALLMGSVLSHFYGLYAAANSFTQLVLRRQRSREEVWKQWPPMAGFLSVR